MYTYYMYIPVLKVQIVSMGSKLNVLQEDTGQGWLWTYMYMYMYVHVLHVCVGTCTGVWCVHVDYTIQSTELHLVRGRGQEWGNRVP